MLCDAINDRIGTLEVNFNNNTTWGFKLTSIGFELFYFKFRNIFGKNRVEIFLKSINLLLLVLQTKYFEIIKIPLKKLSTHF